MLEYFVCRKEEDDDSSIRARKSSEKVDEEKRKAVAGIDPEVLSFMFALFLLDKNAFV